MAGAGTPPQPQIYRYRISLVIEGALVLTDDRLQFRQGVRHLDLPLAAVRAFGVVDRGGPTLGILASELLVRTETTPGRYRLRRFPWNPTAPGCQAALVALRDRLPGAVDTTALPWVEAAAHLGVSPRTWHDALLHPLTLLGVAFGGAGAVAVTAARGHTTDGVGMIVVGVVLVVIGARRGRRRMSPPANSGK